MNQFKVVFMFEFMGYMKNKSFIISTVVLAVVAMALPTIPTVWGIISTGRYTDMNQAVLVDTVRNHDNELLAIYFPDYEFTFLNEIESALTGLEDGTFSWVLEMQANPASQTSPEVSSATSSPILHVSSMNLASFGLQNDVAAYVRELYRRDILFYYNMPSNVVDDFFDMTVYVELKAAGGATDMFFRDYIFAYGLVFMLYIALTMYGQFITTSVVTEKSSKAMEILITAAKPLYLMFGKVLGVTTAGLVQLIILLGAGAISFTINGMFWVGLFFDGAMDGSGINGNGINGTGMESELMQMMMSPVDPMIFVYMLLFFLLGFLLYAFIYASLASTATRIEDVNTVQSIPIILLLAGFFASMFGLGNPGTGFITVLSYVPFFSPMLMLIRYTMGTVGHGGVMISILILIVSIVLMGYLSAKIYRLGVLMYGKPPKMLEVIKMLWTADVG